MGGYGAIRFGMTHPEVFGTVYALHPVGTGSGIFTMYSRPDWKLLTNIRSLDELKDSPFGTIFTIDLSGQRPECKQAAAVYRSAGPPCGGYGGDRQCGDRTAAG